MVQIRKNDDKDFSDVVQGEEYEYRKSVDENFPVKHKFQFLGQYLPPEIIKRRSPNQLVMLSGAMSGFLAGIVVCPLDVVKTRAQALGAFKDKPAIGYAQVFKQIVRDEGIKGLYRGVVPITIGYLPTWTIYFAVYERAKDFYPAFLSNYGIHTPGVHHFVSAVTAGMASSIAVNPVWVVKTRLMIQRGHHNKRPNQIYYHGTIDAFKKMYKYEGMGVFYSGLVPSLFGLLHVGIHFPVYEFLKNILHCNPPANDSKDSGEATLFKLIIASTVSKATASTVTYPHEILRTRLQMRNLTPDNSKGQSLKDITYKIYQKDGLRGFYAGYGINLIRTLPASAVTLVSFEYFKTYLLEISGHSH